MNKYDIKTYANCTDFAIDAINIMANLADFNDNEYSSIVIICKTNLAELLFKIYSTIDVDGFYLDYEYIEFDKTDYEEKEYAICLANDGTLSMEKAWYDDGTCKFFDKDIVLIHAGSNCKVMSMHEDRNNVMCFAIETK